MSDDWLHTLTHPNKQPVGDQEHQQQQVQLALIVVAVCAVLSLASLAVQRMQKHSSKGAVSGGRSKRAAGGPEPSRAAADPASFKAWLNSQPGSTPPTKAARRAAATFQAPVLDDEPQTPPPASPGWDATLLEQCDRNTCYASSVEALQGSPVFQRTMRSKRLNYETSTDHKMRVYKALRKVDPEAFKKLLDDPHMKSYESVTPSILWLAVDYLLAAATTWCLLALPLYLAGPEGQQWRVRAAAWLLLQTLAWRAGCLSPWGLLTGVYEAAGPHQHRAGFLRVACASLLDAGFLVATVGVGALPSLAFRLLSRQRSSVAERLCGLTPKVEVEQPIVV